MKGVYEVGNIKRTKNQKKKHVFQMSEDEKNYLVKKLKEIRYYKIRISKHLMEKDSNLLTFNKQDVINVLKSQKLKSLIIEYNETPLDNGEVDYRVLLRDDNTKKSYIYDTWE